MSWRSTGRIAAWVLAPLAFASVIFAFSYWVAVELTKLGTAVPTLKGDSGWTQAVGAVFAIVAGFAGVIYQVQRQKADAREQQAEAGRAAHLLAFDALETVSERLNAALTPDQHKATHRLRGERTNEMVSAMREFEISRIPPTMLASFIRLRSRIYAINARITHLYIEEKKEEEGWARQAVEAERYRYLHSAVEVRRDAVTLFNELETSALALGAAPLPLTSHPIVENYTRP